MPSKAKNTLFPYHSDMELWKAVTMERADLELVVSLDTAGSLTRAADELHVAQPALSRRLARLEREVGAELFVRGRHGAAATSVGRTLIDRAVVALAAIERAEQDANDAATGRSGRLRIGTTPTLGADLLPGVLARMRSRHPAIRLDLVANGNSTELRDDVRGGHLDVAFAVIDADDLAELHVAAAGPQNFVLACPADHPLASRKVIRPELLTHEPIVALQDGQGLRVVLEGLFASIDSEPLISIETTEREMLIPFVTAGLGVTIVPEIFGRQRAGTGVEIRPFRPHLEREVGAVVRVGRPAALLEQFLEVARASWPKR